MKKSRRLVSLMLSLSMLLTSVPVQAFGEEAAQNTVQSEMEVNGYEGLIDAIAPDLGAGNQNEYFEVKFEIPEELAYVKEYASLHEEELSEEMEAVFETEEALEDMSEGEEPSLENGTDEEESESETEEEKTNLLNIPDSLMVKQGTLISTLEEPKIFGYVFLGWYYDKDYTLMAAAQDVVDRNMTLYAKFGSASDDTAEFSVNYVSEKDVSTDYTILLASYGLTEEEIREKLVLRDFASQADEMAYDLIWLAPDLDLLIEDKDVRKAVQEILDEYLRIEAEEAADPEVSLSSEDGSPTDDNASSPAEDASASEGTFSLVDSLSAEDDSPADDAAALPAQDASASENTFSLVDMFEATAESEGTEASGSLGSSDEFDSEAGPQEDSEGRGRWVTPDGEIQEADIREENTLAGKLLDAGLSGNQVRKITEYYAPEEVDGIDEAILWNVISPLGIDEEDSLNEALQNLLDAYESKEKLIDYLKNSLEESAAAQAASDAFTEDDEDVPADNPDVTWLKEQILSVIHQTGAICPDIFQIRPSAGSWHKGITYQAELLDTENLRFVKDEEIRNKKVIYYNITIAQENYSNIRLGDDVLDILFEEVEGIDLNNGAMISITQNEYGELEAVKNDRSGIMTYLGNKELSVGSVACIHEAGCDFEGAMGYAGDYPITYVKITEDLGNNRYAYIMPEVDEVVFTPDMFPIIDDGTFGDGQFLLSYEELDFSAPLYAGAGLDADAVMEPGDLIAVINVNEENPENGTFTGYGRITDVREIAGKVRIMYDIIQESELETDSGFSQHMDNVPINLSDEEISDLTQQALDELESKNAMQDVQNYVSALVMAEDYEFENPEYKNLLQDITFQTDDGEELSLEEVRKYSNFLNWDDKGTVTTQVSRFCKHFHGTGNRMMISLWKSGYMDAGAKGKIVLTLKLQFETEVCFGVSVDYWPDWDSFEVWGIEVKYPKGYIIQAAGDIGFFVALGVNVTFQTKKKPKTEEEKRAASTYDDNRPPLGTEEQVERWENRFEGVADFANTMETGLRYLSEGEIKDNGKDRDFESSSYGEGTGSVGGNNVHSTITKFYPKYATFLNSGAQYIPIYEGKILPQTTIFHFAIGEISIGINFVLSWKLNVIIGATIQYGIGKQIGVTIFLFSFDQKPLSADLEVPNFTVDFYAFGELGLRAQFEVDFRVGLISTKLDSVGVVLSFGVQAVFYGFFYAHAGWTSGVGWNADFVGSLLIEIDLIASLKFKAQAGFEKAKFEKDIFTVKYPIATLGNERVFVDMTNVDDESLRLEVPAGKDSVELAEKTLSVQAMEMNNGFTKDKDMDSKAAVDGNHTQVTALGETFLQQDEEFFDVTIVDTDKAGKSLGHKEASWWYDPKTNKIYPKPHSMQDTELWGEITFTFHGPKSNRSYRKNDGDKVSAYANYGMGFGIDASGIERKVKVHWKGDPATLTADIYLEKAPYEGIDEITKLQKADVSGKYELAASEKIGETFVGMGVEKDASEKIFNWDSSNYELAFIKMPYNSMVEEKYLGQSSKDSDKKASSLRTETHKNTGYLWANPGDKKHYFAADKSDTRIQLYYNRFKQKAHWIMTDAQTELQVKIPLSTVAIPKDEPVMDYLPESFKTAMEDKEYLYDIYLIPVKSIYSSTRTRLLAGNLLINYPALLPTRSTWTKVESDTVGPDEDYFVMIERKPNTNKKQVTWKYEDAERITFVAPGEKLIPPYQGAKSGYTLLRWEDENGVAYDTMPDYDLVLYPVYVGKAHTILWNMDGELKRSTLRVGDNILETCPFDPPADENQALRWRIGSVTRGTIVAETDLMQDRDLSLFGSVIIFHTVTWKQGDTVLDTTREVVGDLLTPLPLELEEGMVCRWMRDGEPIPANFVMPDEDITLEALVYSGDHEHDWQPEGTWEEPTCIQGSVRHVKCSICLEEADEELPIDPEAHLWGETTYTWSENNDTCTAMRVCERDESHTEVEASRVTYDIVEGSDCSTAGTAKLTAVFGNEAFVTQTKEAAIPTLEHTPADEPVIENRKEATCAEEASYEEVLYCTVCGGEISRVKKTIPGLADHSTLGGSRENYVEATCDEDGGYDEVVSCLVCGEVISSRHVTIPKTGHRPSLARRENYTAPSCDKEGGYDMVSRCSVCGKAVLSVHTAIRKVSHRSGKAVTENHVPSTCIKKGSYDTVNYCTVCGQELKRKTKTLSLAKHTPGDAVIENAEEGLCENGGKYEEVTYCTVCGKELSRKKRKTRAVGHTPGAPVYENVKSATCTQEGNYDEVVYCKVCEAEISRASETVPALGHKAMDPVTEKKQEPTCTLEGGYDEVVYCEVCKEVIKNTHITIPAAGHTPMEAVIEKGTQPTCTEAGTDYSVVYCRICGEEVSREPRTVPALGHTPMAPVTERRLEATCTQEGGYYEVVYCQVCKEVLSSEYRIIPVIPHTPMAAVIENAKDPTCTLEGGYDTVVYCAVCNNIIESAHTTLQPLGHTNLPEVIETVSVPTCMAYGVYANVVYCAVCGETIFREEFEGNAFADHIPGESVIENEIPAQCLENGSYDSVIYCSFCNAELERTSYTIPATGHNLEAYTWTLEENCTQNGRNETIYNCVNGCGLSGREPGDFLPSYGHRYDKAYSYSEPICYYSEAGYCDYWEPGKVFNADGSEFKDGEYPVCMICGYKLNEILVPISIYTDSYETPYNDSTDLLVIQGPDVMRWCASNRDITLEDLIKNTCSFHAGTTTEDYLGLSGVLTMEENFRIWDLQGQARMINATFRPDYEGYETLEFTIYINVFHME